MSVDESITYEQALAQPDETLRSLEEGKLSLEEAIAAVARGRELLEVVTAEGHDLRVEVLPLLLQPSHMPSQDRALAFGQPLQLAEVDCQLWREGRLPDAFDLLRQQLVHRDAVEGGDLVQAGDGDIAVAALVGGEQRALEALVR